MKNITLFVVSLFMATILIACGENNAEKKVEEQAQNTAAEQNAESPAPKIETEAQSNNKAIEENHEAVKENTDNAAEKTQ